MKLWIYCVLKKWMQSILQGFSVAQINISIKRTTLLNKSICFNTAPAWKDETKNHTNFGICVISGESRSGGNGKSSIEKEVEPVLAVLNKNIKLTAFLSSVHFTAAQPAKLANANKWTIFSWCDENVNEFE